MQKWIYWIFSLLVFSSVYGQMPGPGVKIKELPPSPEQRILKYLIDTLFTPELLAKDTCEKLLFQEDNRFAVYDSSWHLPEPLMIYRFGGKKPNAEELMVLTDKQPISITEREGLLFEDFTIRKTELTYLSEDFREGYYFIRFSQPMKYLGSLFFDVSIKEKPEQAGINILFSFSLKNNKILGWQVYSDCRNKEK